MPALSIDDYRARRAALMAQLPKHSIALISSAEVQNRNNDVDYPFRQNSDFYYLTGFTEPSAILVLCAEPEPKTLLFCQPRCQEQERWLGKRLGVMAAKAHLGVDEAVEIGCFDQQLPTLLQQKQTIYYPFSGAQSLEAKLREVLVKLSKRSRDSQTPQQLGDISSLIAQARVIKSPAEQALMAHANKISIDAHRRGMQCVKPGMTEGQLASEYYYVCMQQQAPEMAYPPIVAGGANGCTLHYTANQAVLKDGELVLVDCGCEYQYYAADITRTFPVNGRFSGEQRAIYELVLAAQQAGLAQVQPHQAWTEVQTAMVKVLTQGLVDLAILSGDVDNLLEQKAYRDFYMHGSGHWLGLDVHDVGVYQHQGKPCPLLPGMVLTVEPGLYFSADLEQLDRRWHNIAVRIEDDVLVTENGHHNFTQGLEKTVEDIEALMRQA